MIDNLKNLLRLKDKDGKYIRSVKELAELSGYNEHRFYRSRKPNAKERDMLEKATLYDLIAEAFAAEVTTGREIIINGEKWDLIDFLKRNLKFKGQYTLTVIGKDIKNDG